MKLTIELTDQQVMDLLCTAFEGGSNYWIEKVETPSKEARKAAGVEYFHESPVKGLELAVISEEGRNFLTRESLTLGAEAMARECPQHFADVIRDNHDATTADVFLQCCLFGKVIFG